MYLQLHACSVVCFGLDANAEASQLILVFLAGFFLAFRNWLCARMEPSSSAPAAAAAAGSKVKTWIPGTKSKGKKRPSHIPRVATGKREEIEVTQLQKRVDQEAPPVGSQEATAEAFADLPLSKYTHKGQ